METIEQNTQPFVGAEKTETPMMIYTTQGLVWGTLPHSSGIQPSRILLGVTIPEYMALNEAQAMFMEPNFITKAIKHPRLLVPSSTILGYHLMPPLKDTLDYDPTEPNRKMEPITLYMNALKVSGSIRMSEITDAKTTLEVMKADFLSLYDVEIRHITNTQMSPILTNQAYFRINSILIAV